MRYQTMFFYVVVTLIIIPGTMIFAVPLQDQSSLRHMFPQIAMVPTGSDRTQSPFEVMGFDSGLWRSEYLRPPTEDDDDAQEISGPSPTENPLPEFASLSSDSEPIPKRTTLAAFSYSDSLITMPVDIPVVIDTPGLLTMNASEDDVDTTMSDWDNSIANSAENAFMSSTASGPSATSAILGIVGILIVIGAYVSSDKRNC